MDKLATIEEVKNFIQNHKCLITTDHKFNDDGDLEDTAIISVCVFKNELPNKVFRVSKDTKKAFDKWLSDEEEMNFKASIYKDKEMLKKI